MQKWGLGILVLAGVGLVWLGLGWSDRDPISPLREGYEMAIPYQLPPLGLAGIDAHTCGTCHRVQYEQWRHSTHAHAWTDPQFQVEIKKKSSPWLCINCHIPLQNQQEFIVTGLRGGDIYQPVKQPNPTFNRKLQQEGITCAVCHVRDGAIIGLNGSTLAPHKVVVDSLFLSEQLCIQCHDAHVSINDLLVCTFETGKEWRDGPYYGHKTCINCHMTESQGRILPDYPIRKLHQHYFEGSGIPKFDSIPTKIKNGLSVRLSPLPQNIHIGDSLNLTLELTNQYAGHRVPTGDPERFIRVDLDLIQERKDTLRHQSYRIGEKWQWYPKAIKMSDNNIHPLETRFYHLNTRLTETGVYSITTRITKHRMKNSTAQFHHLKKYPLYITIWDSTQIIRVQ